MNSNLIIVTAGDHSLHSKWLGGNQQFDLVVIYYGDSEETYNKYKSESKLATKNKGEKWHLIRDFAEKNFGLLINYDYIWLPDDDLNTSVNDVNLLFEMSKTFKLWLAQPSISGYINHEILKNTENSLLRFSNFIEIQCPLIRKDIFFKLSSSFKLTESGWGLDCLWPKMLDYPTDKIAIIDAVIVQHTRPTGTDYSRFKTNPFDELRILLKWFQITLDINTLPRAYSTIHRA